MQYWNSLLRYQYKRIEMLHCKRDCNIFTTGRKPPDLIPGGRCVEFRDFGTSLSNSNSYSFPVVKPCWMDGLFWLVDSVDSYYSKSQYWFREWVTRCDRSHTDMSESSQISLPAAHRATQLRRNIGILTEKLDSSRIFFSQIQLLAETHTGTQYRDASCCLHADWMNCIAILYCTGMPYSYEYHSSQEWMN